MVRSRTQGTFGNRQLGRHLPVMLDLCVAVIQMIVKNEFLFVPRQLLQAL
jgi:hypothetical protein